MHHNINQLLWIWKLYGPCCFLHKVPASKWWNESKDLFPSHCNERRSLPEKNKVLLHAWLSWKERGKRGVSGRPGMLKEDKVPAWQRSLSPHPKQASYPEPSRSGGLALSHKSQCHSQGLRHAATCLCLYVQLCVKVSSLTLSIGVCQFPCSFFHCCFLAFTLYFLVGQQWVKPMDAGLS